MQSVNQKNKLANVSLEINDGSTISDLNWYTSDENYKYVLIGTNSGQVILVDLGQSVTVMSFEKHGSGITTCLWVKDEPGTFITVGKNSGRITFWNVSKKSYNNIVKASDSSIKNMIMLSDSSKLLLTIDNGAVVIFDLRLKKAVFALEPNHSETIFDLKYNPLNYGAFATCSYDSSIKIWDLTTQKIISNIRLDYLAHTSGTIVDGTIPGSNQSNSSAASGHRSFSSNSLDNRIIAVYCLKWSPKDKDLLASGDSNGMFRIFDVSKQKMITCLRLGNKDEPHVTGIDWDNHDNLIATCNTSIFYCSFVSGKLNIVKIFKLNTIPNQCKFDPFDNSFFAAGCSDSTLKIFSVSKDEPAFNLTGHQQKVFGIAFNPQRKGVIATTSDDSNVGVFDLSTKNFFFMSGHTDKSRYIIWLNDYPQILISGSWDGSVRFWNVDLKICVFVLNQHYSDVYGIDISPHHPFVLTTCSRDNSIRFWNINLFPKNHVRFVFFNVFR